MKKLISIVLCVAMLCGTMAVSAFCVNAVDNDESKEELRAKIYALCDSQSEPEYPNVDGAPDPFYSEDSYSRRNSLHSKVLSVANNPDSTYEELEQAYDDLKSLEMYISPQWAQESYNFALAEPYNSCWWTESLWADFQTETADLKTALDGGNEKAIDTAYKALNYTLNKACNSKKVHGDVTGDGRISIADVTMIQKHCAGLKTLSMVQRFNLIENYNYEYEDITRSFPSIDSVTTLQKELIGLIDNSYYSDVYNDDYSVRNYILAPVHYYGGYI